MGFKNFGYAFELNAKSYVCVSVRMRLTICVIFGCVGGCGWAWVCFLVLGDRNSS